MEASGWTPEPPHSNEMDNSAHSLLASRARKRQKESHSSSSTHVSGVLVQGSGNAPDESDTSSSDDETELALRQALFANKQHRRAAQQAGDGSEAGSPDPNLPESVRALVELAA